MGQSLPGYLPNDMRAWLRQMCRFILLGKGKQAARPDTTDSSTSPNTKKGSFMLKYGTYARLYWHLPSVDSGETQIYQIISATPDIIVIQ